MLVGSIPGVLGVLAAVCVCAAGLTVFLSRRRSQRLAPWKLIRNGLTCDEVRKILGEPRQVVPTDSDEIWEYATRRHEETVVFTNGTVSGFVKPF